MSLFLNTEDSRS